MTFSTVKALVRLLELTPDFRDMWEDIRFFSSTDFPMRESALFMVYARYISRRLIARDVDGIEPVFTYIEDALAGDDDALRNAVGASLLEALMNQTPSKIDPTVLVPLLGPRSRQQCRTWDEWTGVQTPGLWNTRMSAATALSAATASSDPGEARWPLAHLRDWRLYRGFSQAELAERSGVAISTIAELEVDDPYPDWDHSAGALTMRKLAEALSITRYQLVNSSPS